MEVILSQITLNILNNITAIIHNIATRRIKWGVRIESENKSRKNTTHITNKLVIVTNKILLKWLKGTLILYNNINPVKPVSNTAKVETSDVESLTIDGKIVIIIIQEVLVWQENFQLDQYVILELIQ